MPGISVQCAVQPLRVRRRGYGTCLHPESHKACTWTCTCLRPSHCFFAALVDRGTAVASAHAILVSHRAVEGVPGGSLVANSVRTLTPLPTGKCTSASQCGDTAQFTCTDARQTTCACSVEGQDTCVDLGDCRMSDCGRCSACVASMLPFTQQFAAGASTAANDAGVVAERWASFCNATLPGNQLLCDTVKAQISSSIQGGAGKSAGKLCMLLGSCSGGMAASGCPIITKLLVGTSVRTTLDLCTVEGVAGGARVAGLSVSAALAPGQCYNTSDCKSTSLECANTVGAQQKIYTCTAASGDWQEYTPGTCQKTAAAMCRECMATVRPFALKQATTSNASSIAQEWSSFCSGSFADASAPCAAVASSVADATQAIPGNFGKRATQLCIGMGLCAPNGSYEEALDSCTVQGRPVADGGMRVPGIAASMALPLGRCFSADNCTLPADTCDKSPAGNAIKLCTCIGGVDQCSADMMGTCTIKAGGCSDCKACLASVQLFVAQVLADASKASTWPAFCTNKTGSDLASCQAVSTLGNSTGVNMFRRAGLLCSALQRCSPSIAANCSLGGVKLLSDSRAAANAIFDSCAAEGVSGGKVLPGVSASKTMPSGACQNDQQCGSSNMQCDTSTTTNFCYCVGGVDLCTAVGLCKRTPCAVCNDCLAATNQLVDATRFTTASSDVTAAFTQWCSSQSWTNGGCKSLAATVSSNQNAGKRAGLLCQLLGACSAATLPATCALSVRKSAAIVRTGQLVSSGWCRFGGPGV